MKKSIIMFLVCLFVVSSVTYAEANSGATKSLSDKEKVALAISNDAVAKQSVTAKELNKGVYTFVGNTGKQQKKIKKLTLTPAPKGVVKDAPKDMRFYYASPTKGTFGAVIGMSRSKVVVTAAQNAPNYKDVVKQGHVYDVQTLFAKYKNKGYKNTAKKIEIKK